MNKLPELFDDDYLEKVVKKIHTSCINYCNEDCPHFSELDKDVCKVDIILELWRRFLNVKNAPATAYWKHKFHEIMCSECFFPLNEHEKPEDFLFCPGCGAKMEQNE